MDKLGFHFQYVNYWTDLPEHYELWTKYKITLNLESLSWAQADAGEDLTLRRREWQGELPVFTASSLTADCCSSVTRSCPTLWPHGLQHARLPCPLLSPGMCSNSCPLSQWCYPTISSSVIAFSSCLQSFPSSGSFPMSQLLVMGGQGIGVSSSASVFPMHVQDWFPLGLTGLISLLSKGLSSLLQHQNLKASILWHSAFFIVQLSHPYMTNRKTIALTIWLPGIYNLKFKVIEANGTPRAVEMQTLSGRS